MDSKRYVQLTDQIIDRDKIARLYWQGTSLWVVIPCEPDIELTGEDAQTLWQTFSQPGWMDEEK